MAEEEKSARLSFDELHKYKFPERGQAPLAPVSDYRLAAGILFWRNRETRKYLLNPIGENPYISDNEYGRGRLSVEVTREAVEKLLELNVVEGLSTWGNSLRVLQLSRLGQRLVVTQWFTPEIHDILGAGGIINTTTGDVRWNQDW